MKLRIMRKIANRQLRKRRSYLRHDKDNYVLNYLLRKDIAFSENVRDYIIVRRALGNKTPAEFAKYATWDDLTMSVTDVYKLCKYWARERNKFLTCRAIRIRRFFLP